MNIVEPILHQCRINAEQPAICAPGTPFDTITYAQLEYMINNVIKTVIPFGFEPGQIVGLLLQDTIFHIVVILALTRMGVVTVSCGEEPLSEEIGATALIIDSSEPVTGAKRIIRGNPDWVRGSASTAVDARPAIGDEVCRIFLTSGTSGVPKAVALSHQMLMGRNVQFDYAFGGHWPEQSRLYCDLRIASEPGFRYVLYMLMRGGMIMFYGEDHVRTVQSLDLFKVRSMVTSPRGLADHLKFYERTSIHSSLDHVVALGGGVATKLLRRVWARMSQNVFSDYGATEVGSVASADLRAIGETRGATGYVVPPASVEIMDDETGTSTAANTEGIVRLRTPYMATRYVGQPQASAHFFRDGWFYPGDYGYVTPHGVLVITGIQSA
jgi:acyl-coenzyme A synthetase/AMP-(fatty) acid ligase